MTNQSKPENFQTKESKTENLKTKQLKPGNFVVKSSRPGNFKQNSQNLGTFDKTVKAWELSAKTVLFVMYTALATQLFSLRRVKIYIQSSSEQFHKPCRKVAVVVTFINVPTNIRTP